MTKAPTPAHTADLTTRALTEARALTGPGRPPHDGLAAAALRAHSVLQAGYGHPVPLTALTPTGDAPHALAAFLAVYAAHAPHRPAPNAEPAPATAPPAPLVAPAPPGPAPSPARRPRQPAGRLRVPVPGAGCAGSPSASAPLELRSSERDLTVSRP
ncbi:hypothetical protein AQJ30_23385 [Streptomyces longwoodensis]|uniref:Uncharacterized protein n=1 Tax=Streptomyces longwoodensis TaxID=68231 RepID=A0A117QLY8_9ACTN|nr:hypothetical protein [Streptomyces longwoodensis]KUN35649.1 hypothetical protein AQJ30_23385 [Streptomyces longwoodensis]